MKFIAKSAFQYYPIGIDEVKITATSTAPTTQASAITYSGTTCSGMTVNWTKGNGADRIVVAYPNSTITNPVSGTAYTANSAYGSGTGLGAGFVVYNGTGNSVTVSGLSASTTYYFAVFEFNATNCYMTPGVSSNQATIACGGCPTTNSSAFSFSNINCNGMTVSWTNGNGADRIVVAYPNSTITNPTNGTTYTANTIYGSGTAIGAGSVVYKGTGNSVSVTGLSANTTYYFAIFEFNTTACYLMPGASSNQATIASPTTNSSALTFPGVSCGDIVLSWTNGNGADRIVVAYPNSTITTPAGGTTYTANATYGSGSALGAGFVVYNGTSSTIDVLGLSANTTYYFAVFEYNGTSCYLTPGLSSNQATLANPTTNATALAFPTVNCNNMTLSWTNGNGSDRIVVAYPNSTITTPTTGTVYTANTTYGNGTGLGAGFVVYNGSGSTVTVSGLAATTNYYFAVFEYNGTSCYLTPGTSSNKTTIACAGCPTTNASALNYTGVACSSLTVNWTNGSGTHRIVVAYPNSTITNPTNGTTYTANTTYASGISVGAGYVIYNGTGSTVTVTGLAASTTYYFAVFEYTTTACYLTPGVSSSQATIACAGSPTVAASSLSFSHVGCNSVKLSWTNGNGTNRIVVVYSSSTITTPTTGTIYNNDFNYGNGSALGSGYVVYDSTGNSVVILGLSASTTYWFAVFEYNTTGTAYLTSTYPSSSRATTTCSACPFMSTALTDGCNTSVGCNEGDTEWLLFNTCSYGWNNSANPPSVNYGSTSTGGTHNTAQYTAEPGPTSTLNSATCGCAAGDFIDASAGGIAIPAWSTVLFCADGSYTTDGYLWCPDGYNFSGICSAANPIYVIYGTQDLVYTGNYLNYSSTNPDIRYFNVDFPVSGCDQYYQYDAHQEASGDGAYETYTPSISTNSAAPTNVNTYGQSCSVVNSMLPIQLLSFNAIPDNNVVNLSWQTASEINNKLFTIEKSTDGSSWMLVTTVQGAGNSDHTINYSAIDESPYPNTSYYRLKQTDIDGHSSYSRIATVNFDPLANVLTVIPNPTSNNTTVTFNSIIEGTGTLNIYDIAGRVVDSKQIDLIKGNNSYTFNVSNYNNGLYFISINNSLQLLSSKLIVNH